MCLVESIDRAIEFVREHELLMTEDDVDELIRIAGRVVELAFRSGLHYVLPGIDMRSLVEYPSVSEPPVVLSALNVPGDWSRDVLNLEGETLERAFLPCVPDRWYEAMMILRSLACRDAPAEEPNQPQPKKPKAKGMGREEVFKRLVELWQQGEPFTTCEEMAERFGCSDTTVHRAIQRSEKLKAWAAKGPKRTQRLDDVVLDRTAQSREPAPDDDAQLRELIEQAEPSLRAFLHTVPPEKLRQMSADDLKQLVVNPECRA